MEFKTKIKGLFRSLKQKKAETPEKPTTQKTAADSEEAQEFSMAGRFLGMYGFDPVPRKLIGRNQLAWKKQTEVVYLVLQALARSWRSACLKEEELDKKVRAASLVYGLSVPDEFKELYAAKHEVVRTRNDFDEAVLLAGYFGCANCNQLAKSANGYYSNVIMDNPEDYLPKPVNH